MATTESSRYQAVSRKARDFIRAQRLACRRRAIAERVAETEVKMTSTSSFTSLPESASGISSPENLDACSSSHSLRSSPSSCSATTSVTPSETCTASSRHKQAPHNQGQSSFFRKLPLEVRQQIFAEFWQCAGLNRHVYLEDGDFRFALCETDHDSTDDACQTGLAHDFYPQPRVQNHPKWYGRMTSSWCNHWKCQESMCQRRTPNSSGEEKQDGLSSCIPLLLSCQRIYIESLPSLHKSATLTITDKSTLYALFIRRHRCAIHPVYAFLPRLRTLNIALRAGAPDFLYIHGPALWRALAPATLPALRRISLWLDGHEPIQRRLLPQFRDLWTRIPPSIAHKLSVSLPVGPDGLWAWDEVEVRPWCSGSTGGTGSGVVLLPPFTPEFRVVLRGWQAFTETSAGWISRGGGGQGPGVRRVLAPGNPFEDLRLYGRGWFDEFYFAGSL
ncbi:hypothetical protein VDGD_08151 [Verticillium dahliae]|nr:hypothetical protein VDGD_08151 [Verticillium dahliae]